VHKACASRDKRETNGGETESTWRKPNGTRLGIHRRPHVMSGGRRASKKYDTERHMRLKTGDLPRKKKPASKRDNDLQQGVKKNMGGSATE